MAFNARKLEMVLKEVNAHLEGEGVLTERLTQDIWTKLMSNLMQVIQYEHLKFLDHKCRMKRDLKGVSIKFPYICCSAILVVFER